MAERYPTPPDHEPAARATPIRLGTTAVRRARMIVIEEIS